MRRRARVSRIRREEGQALVEFAIVAPLIVLVLLFAAWFYELVFVKLKAQEAARYAAFEMAAQKLHDYDQGGSANQTLASQATTSVMQETMTRYADLDSDPSTNTPTNNSIFAATWLPPVVLVSNGEEQTVPGGSTVNTIFQIVGTVIDFICAKSYTSNNIVAVMLMALGKDWGGGMTTRMFGSSEWGFNKKGYIKTTVALLVGNNFFGRGVTRGAIEVVMPNFGVLINENYRLLVDPWDLDDGKDVIAEGNRPGYSSSSPFYKQVDRMYLANKRTRGVAKGIVMIIRTIMQVAMGFAMSTASPPGGLGDQDFVRASVVAKNYNDATNTDSGKATVSQDRGSTKTYDTLPVGPKTSSSGSSSSSSQSVLSEYGKTLRNRGKYYMGCTREMSLGCPSSTLSQDNPFGDYIVRE